MSEESILNKEMLFYYESKQNPNGDPGFENQPRLMPDDTIIVTDVRLKRTIRDYAKGKLGKTLFVDFDDEGRAVTADDRAREILGTKKLSGDVIRDLMLKTFDVPLFGALVTVRANDKKEEADSDKHEKREADSYKLTGPVQFGIARSVNKVRVINPMISGRFVGKKKEEGEQHSTFGKFYSVEYALIKCTGVAMPRNLDKYWTDPGTRKAYKDAEEVLFQCLWSGTNELVSRSKYPQKSVFYLEVEYKDVLYNDLGELIKETDVAKSAGLRETPKPLFVFRDFLTAARERKSKIKQIRIAYCNAIAAEAGELISSLKAEGIQTDIKPV